jgi:hypothetical protein
MAFSPSLEDINDGNKGSGLFTRVDEEESEGALELMSQFQSGSGRSASSSKMKGPTPNPTDTPYDARFVPAIHPYQQAPCMLFLRSFRGLASRRWNCQRKTRPRDEMPSRGHSYSTLDFYVLPNIMNLSKCLLVPVATGQFKNRIRFTDYQWPVPSVSSL